MSYEYYRSFKFRYVTDHRTEGAIRIYLENEPSYGTRDKSTYITHRWPANSDRSTKPPYKIFDHPPYICIKEEFKPRSEEAAMRLAHDWADRTLRYISTGIGISEQIRRG